MKLTKEIKQRIDNMSYKELLKKWRFAPVGTPLFEGESGEYFEKVFSEKRKKLLSGEYSAISKEVGWTK